MKKFLFLIAACLAMAGCGTALKEGAQFGSQVFIGKFRDISIYEIETPSGRTLYLGVREDGEPTSIQYSTGGKTPISVPVIIIDGKKVSKEEALKRLQN